MYTNIRTFSCHLKLRPEPLPHHTYVCIRASYLNLRAMRVTALVLFSHSLTRAPRHTRCRISTLGGGKGGVGEER